MMVSRDLNRSVEICFLFLSCTLHNFDWNRVGTELGYADAVRTPTKLINSGSSGTLLLSSTWNDPGHGTLAQITRSSKYNHVAAGSCEIAAGELVLPAPEEIQPSESLARCGDESVAVVDEDWTHRVVNPRALSPTVGAKCRGVNRR